MKKPLVRQGRVVKPASFPRHVGQLRGMKDP